VLLIANRVREDETDEGELVRRRYFELVGLGYSPATSLILSEAPSVALASITELIVPDED